MHDICGNVSDYDGTVCNHCGFDALHFDGGYDSEAVQGTWHYEEPWVYFKGIDAPDGISDHTAVVDIHGLTRLVQITDDGNADSRCKNCQDGNDDDQFHQREAFVVFLSDFPPEQKGEIWGLKKYCDLCFSTEEYGALKPSPVAFFKMAEQLGIQKEEILYVGNNHKYDVMGPKKIGMKAAWFVSPLKGKLGKKSKAADFIFWKYSQLESFIFDGND